MLLGNPFMNSSIFIPNNQDSPHLCPGLAKEIGLNESILLLEIEHSIHKLSTEEHDGILWICLSTREIQKRLEFWSLDTINRTIKNLHEKKLIDIDNFNEASYDRTRWFTLNIEECSKLFSIKMAQDENEPMQNRTGSMQNRTGSMQNRTGSMQNRTGSTIGGKNQPEANTPLLNKDIILNTDLLPKDQDQESFKPPVSITVGNSWHDEHDCVTVVANDLRFETLPGAGNLSKEQEQKKAKSEVLSLSSFNLFDNNGQGENNETEDTEKEFVESPSVTPPPTKRKSKVQLAKFTTAEQWLTELEAERTEIVKRFDQESHDLVIFWVKAAFQRAPEIYKNVKNILDWPEQIHAILTRDKRPLTEFKELSTWLFYEKTQNTDFWVPNIRSPGKLRKISKSYRDEGIRYYDMLFERMRKEKSPIRNAGTGSSTTNYTPKQRAYQEWRRRWVSVFEEEYLSKFATMMSFGDAKRESDFYAQNVNDKGQQFKEMYDEYERYLKHD